MPITILPASAAAFAPRSAPTIVLGSRVEAWLTQTLKRTNRVKRPLNSVPQHYRCLTETLGGPSALWELASIMVPKAPDSELRKDPNLLIEALFNYQLIHIEAYVVHVDMVSQHEVAFKLTTDTIELLVEYHKDIYSIDVAANTWNWSEKEHQLKKLQENFVQAVNRYVYRTHVRALEGLEDDGAGELLEGRSGEVKTAIMGMFLPLLPPPPRIVDVVHPAPVMMQVSQAGQWWQPMQAPTPLQQQLVPVDPWRVLGSTPSPTTTCGESLSSSWSSSGLSETHLPSPTPSYSQPYSTCSPYYSSPQAMPSIPALPLPMPSVIAQQCGTSAAIGAGYGGFGWNYNDFMPQYPIHI